MTALYIADITIEAIGRPKMRANQKKKPATERHLFSFQNRPLVLIDGATIHPETYNRAMTALLVRTEKLKHWDRYIIKYSLENVRFSSKIMVDLTP